MFNLLFFQLYNEKMSKLTKSQIEILTNHYVRSFDTWEA